MLSLLFSSQFVHAANLKPYSARGHRAYNVHVAPHANPLFINKHNISHILNIKNMILNIYQLVVGLWSMDQYGGKKFGCIESMKCLRHDRWNSTSLPSRVTSSTTFWPWAMYPSLTILWWRRNNTIIIIFSKIENFQFEWINVS